MNQSERKMIKRNLLTSSLCLVLLLMMLLSSTLAWFTDSKGNVNVMTAGKIGIDQVETFEQNTYIMPNVPITKNVVVKNTGNQEAYVRTLFAFEDNADGMVLSKLILTKPDSVQIVIPGVTDTNAKVQFTVTKDGVTTLYTVGYYIHDDALAVNGEKSSINPLQSITLDGSATNAWHEAVGTTYEVIVLSQATQVVGMESFNGAAGALNAAFDEITGTSCAMWFDAVIGDNNDVVAAYPAP